LITDLDTYKTTYETLCIPEDCSRLINNTNISLKVMTQNIRSIACNIDNFDTLLVRTNIPWDLLVLTECWLPKTGHIPVIPGYDYAATNNNLTQNEGVVVYYRLNLCPKIEEPLFTGGNCLIIKVNPSTVIVAIYRPPGYKDPNIFLTSLNSVLGQVHTYQNIVIMGDINIDVAHNTNDERSCGYLNLLSEFNIHPGHRIPTRNGTCLDHVMVKSNKHARCFVMPSTITDHYSVVLDLDLTKDFSTRCMTRLTIDQERLDSMIKNLDLLPLYRLLDANEAAQYLTNTLMDAIKHSTNEIKISRRKCINKPWITLGLLRCMRNRDNLHKKAKSNPDDIDKTTTYKRYRNYCNTILKKVKRAYERELIQKSGHSTKKLWNTISITSRNIANLVLLLQI
jgi:hypothetical protein